MKTNNPIVQLQHICKEYPLGKTTIPALVDVSMEIEEKDFLVVAGPSGSGKTTLLNLVGLIDKPTSGRIVFGGEEVTDRSMNHLTAYRRDRLGLIFQMFNLIPVLSVYENVEYPLMLKRLSQKVRHERIERVLEKTGLWERKKHKPRELSGGQRQRVAIARAIVKDPDIVLADEPTANLDSKTGAEIVGLMERLNGDDGIAFVFSSHDPMIVERGKRVVSLHDGRVQGIKARRTNR